MDGFLLEKYDCCEISIGNTHFRIFYIPNLFSESQEWNSPQHGSLTPKNFEITRKASNGFIFLSNLYFLLPRYS